MINHPTNETIHEGTIEVIRRITDDGMLSDHEVWDLAEYLNDNSDACAYWPGCELFPKLHEVFADGVLDGQEIRALANNLAEIEERVAEAEEAEAAEAEEPEYETVSLASICVESFVLPQADKTMQIACKRSDETYKVSLRAQSCSCPAWKGNRKDFPVGDLKRACVHLLEAYSNAAKAGEVRLPGIFTDVFEELASRGRGIDLNSEWKFVKIQTLPHLVFIGPEWCAVYARLTSDHCERYAYNLAEQRWAYGNEPKNHLYLEKLLNRSVDQRPVATLASQPA